MFTVIKSLQHSPVGITIVLVPLQGTIFSWINTGTNNMCFFCYGMATSIVGANLLELMSQTETSNADMALLFTWRGLGAMAATVFVGVVYNKMIPEDLLCIGVVVLGLGQIAMAACSLYAQFVGSCYLQWHLNWLTRIW